MRRLLNIVLLAYVAVSVYPMFWMLTTSLKTQEQMTDSVWSLPVPPTLANLREAWTSGRGERDEQATFVRAYWNSVVVCVCAGAAGAGLAALAGFAFARLRFPGANVLFYVFLLGMMIPVHVTLIPLLRLLSILDLRRTYLALIGPYVGFALPLSIFILRGFFERIPRELEEAARADGCGVPGVFWHVALPAARPALATVVIFNFVTMWNEYVFALVFLDAPELNTIPLALDTFRTGEAGTNMPLTCAGIAISVLPLLVVFLLAQRHIIRGLTAGAVKG